MIGGEPLKARGSRLSRDKLRPGIAAESGFGEKN
jgi:hypothetical protein